MRGKGNEQTLWFSIKAELESYFPWKIHECFAPIHCISECFQEANLGKSARHKTQLPPREEIQGFQYQWVRRNRNERQAVGWKTKRHTRTFLIFQALKKAYRNRWTPRCYTSTPTTAFPTTYTRLPPVGEGRALAPHHHQRAVESSNFASRPLQAKEKAKDKVSFRKEKEMGKKGK